MLRVKVAEFQLRYNCITVLYDILVAHLAIPLVLGTMVLLELLQLTGGATTTVLAD